MVHRNSLSGVPPESLVVAVTETVAERRGVEPTDLRPLSEVINPDALNAVFEPADTAARNEGRVVFPYYGYEVRVTADRAIEIADASDQRDGAAEG
jgi:hypothetical protein